MSDPHRIESRENSLFKDLRRLAQESSAYRKQGRVWVEGDHLCGAALARGVRPSMMVCAESAWVRLAPQWGGAAGRNLVIADSLFNQLSGLESPAPMAFVLPLGESPALVPGAPSVVLDRLQDAGNVGAILRCASAFGFSQVIALKGTAALWSPKVLRAGMGAHFGLRLIEGAAEPLLGELTVPLLATSSHQGEYLHRRTLPWPCAWLLGHEGQGISPEVAARAAAFVRIIQPGGEESLNVATAAAICLHASAAGQAP